jgi:hypothetical protein
MNDRDIAEKMAALAKHEIQAKTQGGAATNPLGMGLDTADRAQPMRENLTGRFRSQLQRAQRESRRETQLAELLDLLDKNPEVARILDLIDSLGGGY